MRNHALSKVCEQCGEVFAPRSNFAKHCDSCTTFTCDYCGKQYSNRRGRATRFCSLECTNVWQDTPQAKEEARQRTIAKRGGGHVIRCATCNELFYAPKWRLNQGVKYCSHDCRDYHEDMKGINRELRFPAIKEANQLEQAGAVLLDNLGVRYLTQQIIGGKFVVDALLPDHAIIVQWDGDFWHGNPAIYINTIWPIQDTNRKRDRACNAYLEKCGYTVLRFWESDVHNSPHSVLAELRRALESSART